MRIFICCYLVLLPLVISAQPQSSNQLIQQYWDQMVHQYQKQEYNAVLSTGKEALEKHKTLLQRDSVALGVIYSIIGSGFTFTNQLDSSLYYAQAALSLLEAQSLETLANAQDTLLLKVILRDYQVVGTYHSKQLDHYKAERYYQKGLTLGLKFFDPISIEAALFYRGIGRTYYLRNKPQKAISYYNKAYQCYSKDSTQKKGAGVTLIEMAEINQYLKNYDLALEQYQEALGLIQELYGEENYITSIIYEKLGYFYEEKLDYELALRYTKKSLQIIKKIYGNKNPMLLVSPYENLSILYYKIEDHIKGDEYFFHSLKALNFDPYQTSNFANVNLSGICAVFKNRMYCYQSLYNKQQDTKYLDTLQALVNQVQSIEKFVINQGADYKSNYSLYLTYFVYESLLGIQLTSPKPDYERAFFYAERAKSRVLHENLRLTEAGKYLGIPENLLEQVSNLVTQGLYIGKNYSTLIKEMLLRKIV